MQTCFLRTLAKHAIWLVSLPLVISFLVCVLYTWFVSRSVTNIIYDHLRSHKKALAEKKYMEVYESLNIRLNKNFINIHIIGTLCYFVVGLIIAIVCIIFADADYKLVFYLGGVSLISGILWDILGYFLDAQVNWCCVIKDFNMINSAEKSKVFKEKFICHKAHFIWYVICLFFIIAFAIVAICLYLNSNLATSFGWNYYFFISLFVTVLTIYTKMIISHFYVKKDYETSGIYPCLHDFKY